MLPMESQSKHRFQKEKNIRITNKSNNSTIKNFIQNKNKRRNKLLHSLCWSGKTIIGHYILQETSILRFKICFSEELVGLDKSRTQRKNAKTHWPRIYTHSFLHSNIATMIIFKSAFALHSGIHTVWETSCCHNICHPFTVS